MKSIQTEIEAKFLGINTKEFRKKLVTLGARKEHKEILMKRRTFDDAKKSLSKVKGWIRVRDEGNKITLSYKQLNDRTLHGTKEITVVVDNFDNTCDFLKGIGFVEKSYQETKREKWILNDVEVTIDTWPWIPSFVELEASNEKVIKKVAKILDLDWKNALHGSVEVAYQKDYDVTEKEIDSWKAITFISAPK